MSVNKNPRSHISNHISIVSNFWDFVLYYIFINLPKSAFFPQSNDWSLISFFQVYKIRHTFLTHYTRWGIIIVISNKNYTPSGVQNYFMSTGCICLPSRASSMVAGMKSSLLMSELCFFTQLSCSNGTK